MPRCPVCDDPVDLDKTPTVPFCSARCRLVDMGRWLGESYGLPVVRRPDAAEDGPDAGDPDAEG
jgi:endogenous inhibitor of DNA gyrase (YacG/DUF329 family)